MVNPESSCNDKIGYPYNLYKMNSNRYCVISAVGHNSLHRLWIADKAMVGFDLHLLVYDNSVDTFKDDSEYVCHMKGQKLWLTYQYISQHSELIDKYDYFFIPDDDIKMQAKDIMRLFECMEKYELKIAQPSLRCSYFSWSHVLRDNCCRLRYTNFVEMMVPCFSREALKTVLFTFNENFTGWGTETHWPLLIKTNHKDMAIIDEVSVMHTRPIQSGTSFHRRELYDYHKKFNLVTTVEEYCYLECNDRNLVLTNRDKYNYYKNNLLFYSDRMIMPDNKFGLEGLSGVIQFLVDLSDISNVKKLEDRAESLLANAFKHIYQLKDDMYFEHGITGFSWLIERLYATGHIEENPEEILKEIDIYIAQYVSENRNELSEVEIAGVGMYYVAKVKNRPTKHNLEILSNVVSMLPKEVSDESFLLDVLLLKQSCGYNIKNEIKEIRNSICEKKCTQVNHVYDLFKYYQLTMDEDIRVILANALVELPRRLLTIRDARHLAEILSYNINNPKS